MSDLERHQVLYQHVHLRPNREVLDNIPGARQLIDDVKGKLTTSPDIVQVVWFEGESKVGKSVAARQALAEIEDSRVVSKKLAKKGKTLHTGTLSLDAGLKKGRREGVITTPFDQPHPPENILYANEAMLEAFLQAYRDSERPLAVIIDNTTSPVQRLLLRKALLARLATMARHTPDIEFNAIFVVTDKEKQEGITEERNNVSSITSSDQAQNLLSTSFRTVFDREIGNLEDYQTSYGSSEQSEQVYNFMNDNLLLMRPDIRHLERSIPYYEREDLEASDDLRQSVQHVYYQIIRERLEIPEGNTAIGSNLSLPRRKQIHNLYARFVDRSLL